MFLGFLLIGVMAGLFVSVTTLVLGYSIWMALLVYALVGVSGMVLGMLATLVPAGRQALTDDDFYDMQDAVTEG